MSIQKFIVSRDDNIYEAWPDVALTNDGTLICTFTECAHHGDRNYSRVMMTESYDRGRTWTQKHPLSELSMQNDFFNNSRISKLPDGTLVVICDRSFGKETPTTEYELYLWYSYDNGKTWTEPKLASSMGIKNIGFVPDKYRILKNGRHIICAQSYGSIGKLEQYLWYSDDEGKTWSDKTLVAKDERYNLCEGCILETPDGVLACYMRENSGLGYDCMKVISYDSGETWSDVCNVPLPGCHRPVISYLKSGNLMMTYRFMQGGKGWVGYWTQNVFSAILKPDQVTCTKRREQSARIMPLDFDRSPVSDLGYTGWVQFDDGEIYVVNYIVDDAPKAQIRGYSFTESEFILNP